MEVFTNTFMSVGEALKLFTSSVNFVIELVAYLPAVLGSAVIVFLTVYIIRFCLLK